MTLKMRWWRDLLEATHLLCKSKVNDPVANIEELFLWLNARTMDIRHVTQIQKIFVSVDKFSVLAHPRISLDWRHLEIRRFWSSTRQLEIFTKIPLKGYEALYLLYGTSTGCFFSKRSLCKPIRQHFPSCCIFNWFIWCQISYSSGASFTKIPQDSVTVKKNTAWLR